VYAGAFVSGRNSKRGPEHVRVENACPAIIDRETFNKVQEQLNAHRPNYILEEWPAVFSSAASPAVAIAAKLLLDWMLKEASLNITCVGLCLKKGLAPVRLIILITRDLSGSLSIR